MDKWIRDNFEEIEDDLVFWVSENGVKTASTVDVIVSKFGGCEINYESFAAAVETPTDNPEDEGVNWGNHVRAWRDQGKFES